MTELFPRSTRNIVVGGVLIAWAVVAAFTAALPRLAAEGLSNGAAGGLAMTLLLLLAGVRTLAFGLGPPVGTPAAAPVHYSAKLVVGGGLVALGLALLPDLREGGDDAHFGVALAVLLVGATGGLLLLVRGVLEGRGTGPAPPPPEAP